MTSCLACTTGLLMAMLRDGTGSAAAVAAGETGFGGSLGEHGPPDSLLDDLKEVSCRGTAVVGVSV